MELRTEDEILFRKQVNLKRETGRTEGFCLFGIKAKWNYSV